MRTLPIGLFLTAALAVSPATLAAVAPSSDAPLVGTIRLAFAAAPTNFNALRSGVPAAGSSEIDYKPSSVLAKMCPHCVIADEFATAKTDERWSLQFDWGGQGWTRERMLAYILSTLGPLVPAAAFTQGTDGESGASWFQWEKSKTEFLYAQTFGPDKQGNRGFTVRVVRYVPKNTHIVRLSRGLTATDRSELTKAIRNYVTIAIANADTNFESLRGKESTDHLTKNDPDQFFGANVAFGDLMTSCDVDSLIFPASDAADESHWVFACDVVPVGGPKADVLAAIHDAVAAALPYGFTVTADPKYLNSLDYRWDRSSDRVMVSIGDSDDDRGSEFFLDVHHYIANQ